MQQQPCGGSNRGVSMMDFIGFYQDNSVMLNNPEDALIYSKLFNWRLILYFMTTMQYSNHFQCITWALIRPCKCDEPFLCNLMSGFKALSSSLRWRTISSSYMDTVCSNTPSISSAAALSRSLMNFLKHKTEDIFSPMGCTTTHSRVLQLNHGI